MSWVKELKVGDKLIGPMEGLFIVMEVTEQSINVMYAENGISKTFSHEYVAEMMQLKGFPPRPTSRQSYFACIKPADVGVGLHAGLKPDVYIEACRAVKQYDDYCATNKPTPRQYYLANLDPDDFEKERAKPGFSWDELEEARLRVKAYQGE